MTCPACGRPRGVRLAAKTATCTCGKRIPVPQMKPLFSTDNPRELPEALGRIRAELAGRGQEFQDAVEAGRSSSEPPGRGGGRTRGPGMREAALQVLQALEEGDQGFDLKEAERALGAAGFAADAVLEALREENLLYEVGSGRFRLV